MVNKSTWCRMVVIQTCSQSANKPVVLKIKVPNSSASPKLGVHKACNVRLVQVGINRARMLLYTLWCHTLAGLTIQIGRPVCRSNKLYSARKLDHWRSYVQGCYVTFDSVPQLLIQGVFNPTVLPLYLIVNWSSFSGMRFPFFSTTYWFALK